MQRIANWLRGRALVVVGIALILTTGSSAIEGYVLNVKRMDQESFNRATITFEKAMLDPKDPTLSPSDINDARVRLGLPALPEEQLAQIAQRMGVTNAR